MAQKNRWKTLINKRSDIKYLIPALKLIVYCINRQLIKIHVGVSSYQNLFALVDNKLINFGFLEQYQIYNNLSNLSQYDLPESNLSYSRIEFSTF